MAEDKRNRTYSVNIKLWE